jgi:ubiquinone/menaquinone biosynthesis C-methylase UbiE
MFLVRIITIDDIIDTFLKIKQRGLYFILSKFNLSNKSRMLSAFDDSSINSSNWWNVEQVKRRWSFMISGNSDNNYQKFVMTNYIKDKSKLKLISFGSGKCHNEFEFAKYPNFELIICVDIAKNRLIEAKKNALKNGIENKIKFINKDISKFYFEKEAYDIVLFNSSLHHFKNIKKLIQTDIHSCLKKSGILIINEYVGPNRLQFKKHQIEMINKALNTIPKKFKVRYRSNLIKNKFYGSGLIRMIVSDPSECVESENILPSIRESFQILTEKGCGGNILMNVLKDISHNFKPINNEKINILNQLFSFEDDYLKNNSSDFVFGVYKKR